MGSLWRRFSTGMSEHDALLKRLGVYIQKVDADLHEFQGKIIRSPKSLLKRFVLNTG